MARQARKSPIDDPGALQHVIGHGIHCQEIFSDKADYKESLEMSPEEGETHEILTAAVYPVPKTKESLRKERRIHKLHQHYERQNPHQDSGWQAGPAFYL